MLFFRKVKVILKIRTLFKFECYFKVKVIFKIRTLFKFNVIFS